MEGVVYDRWRSSDYRGENKKKLLDLSDPVEAFKRLVKPEDVVGIKTNVWSFLPTPAPVETTIRRAPASSGAACSIVS